jgi:hypothetical protein
MRVRVLVLALVGAVEPSGKKWRESCGDNTAIKWRQRRGDNTAISLLDAVGRLWWTRSSSSSTQLLLLLPREKMVPF